MTQPDTTNTLRLIVDVAERLRRASLFRVSQALSELSDNDLNELEEALRLVRSFVNNA